MMAILTCYCVPVYMILCHNSHSHFVLLYSSVSNGHSHLVCVVFQCTWYSVMTAILTLCVLYSSVPDTVSWRPFSPCVCCIPAYLILCHDSHSHLVCVVSQDSVLAQVNGDEFHINTKELARRTLTSKWAYCVYTLCSDHKVLLLWRVQSLCSDNNCCYASWRVQFSSVTKRDALYRPVWLSVMHCTETQTMRNKVLWLYFDSSFGCSSNQAIEAELFWYVA